MARDVAETARGTSDVAGTCRLSIRGPHRVTSRWQLTSVVVQSERVGDGTYPVATMYRSVVADANVIGTSRAADRVTFDATGDYLLPGDQLVAVVEQTAPGTSVVVNLFAVEVP